MKQKTRAIVAIHSFRFEKIKSFTKTKKHRKNIPCVNFVLLMMCRTHLFHERKTLNIDRKRKRKKPLQGSARAERNKKNTLSYINSSKY